ncbi:rhamnogalacturonan acetylesterase [Pedobacter gandavensis]|uniref:GntR family transcriptional regulator n=1 Tax=Pedobacter gandavensis TaxID=2679963 RepID=A0ABR6ER23_9SPHI|nr:rhamnogalacturonan acetylesterase [Pedobacter gandavensis]MBB2147700.1 GntR family transcriptional regulator [Pedobacter gandavensis]
MQITRFTRLKIAAVGLLCVCTAFISEQKPIKVWMIGDSTMCNYESSKAPLTGWGMPFAGFFTAEVQLNNRAKGGRSTRTFISENRWGNVADSLSKGDYVLIQFGHNDEAKEEKYKERYTSVPDYEVNLARFIKESRAKNAVPILITPVSRMSFDKDGHAKETHAEYRAAVYEVAKRYDVPLIDLDRDSRAMYEKMGPMATKKLFMQLEPGVHPNYPEGKKDNTHFTEFGARKIAQLVLSEMKQQQLELCKYVVQPKALKK